MPHLRVLPGESGTDGGTAVPTHANLAANRFTNCTPLAEVDAERRCSRLSGCLNDGAALTVARVLDGGANRPSTHDASHLRVLGPVT